MKNTMCRRVVGFDRGAGRRLWMPHFDESGNDGDGCLSVQEETASFGFGSGGSNGTNGFAEDMNGAIGLGVRRRAGGTWKGSEEKMASSTASSIRKNKVGGIGADSKNHVAGMVADGSIRMRGEIVEQHIAGLFGVFGGRSLVAGDFVQRNNHSGVTAAGIVEKEAGNLLDTFDAEFVEEGRDVSGSKLCGLTVDWSRPAMRGMLRSGWWGMTQREKGFGYVARHGDVNVAGIIVPVDFETEVTGPRPVFCERIFGGEGSKKMVGIGPREKFNTEVINSKSKSGATVDVAPKTWSLTDREVTKRSKVGFELVVRKDGSFFETVHAFANFDVKKAFGVEVLVCQSVFGNDLRSEIPSVDPHVLINEHIRDKEEIFQVASAVAGAEVSIGNNTVEVELGVSETNCGRPNVLVGVKTVATNRHADAVGFSFAWSHGADEIGIGDLAASRDLIRVDENHGVVASDLFAEGAGLCETLSAAAPFIGQ